ncbi:sulfotransferase domain-containing protein [Tamilnaduibacter salinus]
MRLVYVVRNPLERYISHFLQRTKAGLETRSFDETFENLENEPCAWQGRYYYQLSQYMQFFPKDQLLVISFDEIKSDTQSVIQKLYRFLDVPEIKPETSSEKVHNASGKVYRKNAFGLAVLGFYRRYVEQKNLPFRFKKLFKDIANWGGKPVEKPRLTTDQKKLLIDFYRDDNRQLEEEFGVRTSQWFGGEHD